MTYSYTRISRYLTCPRRYRHRYLDGSEQEGIGAGRHPGSNALRPAFEQAGCVLFSAGAPGVATRAKGESLTPPPPI
ncbi:MAG: hypothetical protein ABSE40_21510 [Candidatus Sulfotelmatobacter sp.]